MNIAMRDAFGEALVKLGAENDKLRVLDADVSSSTKTCLFGKAYPERFYNIGVAEANMTDIAAGMATCGWRPVISAFAIFLALKATDQIRNVICYNRLPVIIAGGYSGLSDSFDGASHQSITDIAIMRAMPEMTVIVPSNAEEIEPALRQALNLNGPVYLRLSRNPTSVIKGTGENFRIGKNNIFREGKDLTIAVCGVPTSFALEAADKLQERGIEAEILNISTIKPLDCKTLLKSVIKTGCLLSVEEHSIVGGFGSALAEAIVQNYPVQMDFIGVEDTFTESGPYIPLMEKYGLSASNIVNRAEALVKKNRDR